MPASRLPIIGYPLAASPLESVIRAGLKAVESPLAIEPWERRPHQLAEALKEIRAGEDIAGALIASPHKEKAPPLSDALSDDARVSGAVNVYVRVDGRLRGHNTDADGIRIGLQSILPKVKGKWPRNAVVLGAGGGARAVVAVLIAAGGTWSCAHDRGTTPPWRPSWPGRSCSSTRPASASSRGRHRFRVS
jgi:shikimate dehydrogenase